MTMTPRFSPPSPPRNEKDIPGYGAVLSSPEKQTHFLSPNAPWPHFDATSDEPITRHANRIQPYAVNVRDEVAEKQNAKKH